MTDPTSEQPPGGAGEPAGAAPHCYRHPDRETYVSCVRCGRPICPDCMTAASVGFQCPDCVRAGRASVRPARTPFGGLMPANAGAITRVLIGLCAIAWLFELASSTFEDRFDLVGRVFRPQLGGLVGVAEGQYYRLLTSAFLHASWLHIFFNMYALLIVGPPLEAAFGRARFLSLYILSALGGSTLAYILIAPNQPVVGASGAIFGLFGALFIAARRTGRDAGGILALIVINLVLTFAIPGIAWQGHLGGLATGSALALAYAYAPRDRQLPVQLLATGGVVAIIVIGVVARTAQLT